MDARQDHHGDRQDQVDVTGAVGLAGLGVGLIGGRPRPEPARSADGTRVWQIDPDKCTDCGACVEVCPVECIDMREMQTDRPPQSWNEYQATGERI